jgi:signal transduction histidine kinase
VVLNYAENLPQIMAVSDQIKQVFLNLLTNAVDACHKGGGVITISTWQENDRVAVSIKDNGVGIKPEEMEHIFRPFFTTKPEVKGTGLGLSVSYGIIKNHHGEFRVDSQPGKGATFTVLLPIKAEVTLAT